MRGLVLSLGVLAVAATAIVVGAQDVSTLELGDVRFPHEFHYADLEVECAACHHETNAARLGVPHEEYFGDLWSRCTTCHRENVSATTTQSCRGCHHDSPTDIADETLSSKVVIHRSCWECHDVGTGREASRSCKTCHSGRVQPAGGVEQGVTS